MTQFFVFPVGRLSETARSFQSSEEGRMRVSKRRKSGVEPRPTGSKIGRAYGRVAVRCEFRVESGDYYSEKGHHKRRAAL
jgi:hypothetical protein